MSHSYQPRIDSLISGGNKILLGKEIKAIPFAILLFFLFPRFSGALWLLQTQSNLAPDTITPRLRRLVDSLIKTSTTDQKFDPTRYAFSIFSHFNQNPFVYSLRPPLLLSNSPVDEFIFSSRKGFCEHYASSFVTLMRAANVPSRLVIGYLGGEHN